MSTRGLVAALTACAAVGAVAACATQVAGKGTGAGPRNGPPASSTPTSGPSASQPPSSNPSHSKSSAAPGTHPAPSRPLRTVTAHGSNGAVYVVKLWAEKKVTDCPAHAYGAPVVDFLRRHPCSELRSVLATTVVGGRRVGFAQRSIGFGGAANASYRAAGQFRALVSRSGTGNLNDLLREGYRLPGGPTQVPFPNAFHAEGQDNSVTVTEAWFLHGATPDNDPALERMERDIFLQV